MSGGKPMATITCPNCRSVQQVSDGTTHYHCGFCLTELAYTEDPPAQPPPRGWQPGWQVVGRHRLGSRDSNPRLGIRRQKTTPSRRPSKLRWVAAVALVGFAGAGTWMVVQARGLGQAQTADSAPRATPSVTPTPSPPKLVTKGVSVQVLNGTNKTGPGNAMAYRLRKLGYDVLVVNPASSYSETTVFWSKPNAKVAATALGARFGWRVAPKPKNLSSDVSIHVVVGKDELS